MIVLGCKVEPWGPSILLRDRMDKALDYLENHPDLMVVVSGGQGPDEHVAEAVAMEEYLQKNGVPGRQIIVENQSHNTVQNLILSRKVLGERDEALLDHVVIVSNGFHLRRVRMLADRAGYENVSTLAAPATHVPSKLKMYVREPLALVKSFVFDHPAA